MLTPPADLPADLVRSVLTPGWGVSPISLTYQPVGFGSHHRVATGPYAQPSARLPAGNGTAGGRLPDRYDRLVTEVDPDGTCAAT